MSEFVEFSVLDPDRFQALQQAFSAFKEDKGVGEVGGVDRYLPYFDAPSRSYFWWPTPEEVEEHRKRWFATPLETRWSDPSLKHGWTFDSMVEAFSNGDYSLGFCEMTEPGIARLTFTSFGYPYGGTGAFMALIEAFGHRVLIVYDGADEPQEVSAR